MNNKEIMLYLVEKSVNLYMCNRPPGPAAAMLIPYHSYSRREFDIEALHIITGVNAPIGSPNCKQAGCEIEHGHCVRAIHAEQAAICKAALYGMSTNGSIMFSVLKPCYQCSKLIIAAGVIKIYYAGIVYDEDRTANILFDANVLCEKVDVGLSYGQ